MSDDGPALICAYEITGSEATSLSWAELDEKTSGKAWRWVHLDREHRETETWLKNGSGIPELASKALLAEETRPRVIAIESGHIVILRGINHHPDASPEDMVSIRLWIEENRIISVRRLRFLAIQDIRTLFERGFGLQSPGAFLAELSHALVERISPIVHDLEDQLDELEETGVSLLDPKQRDLLLILRRRIIPLRRFLSPQRDALNSVSNLRMNWITKDDSARLREAYDDTLRFVETLDAARERAALFHEQIATRLAERSNRNMYILAVVAAIFLPLGLLTGLLGTNVGGIPGSNTSWAFLAVTALIIVVGAIEYAVLKFMRWI